MESRNYLIDFFLYIICKISAPLFCLLPTELCYWLGRRLGDLFYLVDLKHRLIAYANIRTAFCNTMDVVQLRKTTRKFFQAFGQNIIEIFLIPRFNQSYFSKYVKTEGQEYVQQAFSKKKGVIFVAVHAGSWELANIVASFLGIPLHMFVRQQKLPCVNRLLDTYRKKAAIRPVIKRGQIRDIIRVLKKNEAVVMTIDQGGKKGRLVSFFGKSASMATGAVRLALELGCMLVPVMPVRLKGPYVKFIALEPIEIKATSNIEQDIQNTLEKLVNIFEEQIRKYPYEYLWTYKVWKYSKDKTILVLSDGKVGHLRQAQSLAKLITSVLREQGYKVSEVVEEVVFHKGYRARLLSLSGILSGKYICQGCLLCMRKFLLADSRDRLLKIKPDIIVSCGSAVAIVNYLLSRENQAFSVVAMRPSFLSFRRFNLVVMPQHDRPPKRKNVVITKGALNLIDEDYLSEQAHRLRNFLGEESFCFSGFIGLLLGGKSKKYNFGVKEALLLINSLKEVADKHNFGIMATTSRRTSQDVEEVIEEHLQSYKRALFVVIASKKNYPFTVGGILALSNVVVVTAESISMVSEACTSGKKVVVLDNRAIRGRHRRFLDTLAKEGYLRLGLLEECKQVIEEVIQDKKEPKRLDDNSTIILALKKLLK
ncbi:MAG: mitochondrial fission ELM1 family protein [Candidatus Omnitrophica bacterium]|nr:mitochondrial fission ELM1 family protein [Candidatus Omnitrophota bacterium]